MDTKRAIRIRKTPFISAGVILELLGFCLLFICIIFPPGIILGIAIMVYGHTKTRQWYCGSCMNKLENKTVQICQVCQARLYENETELKRDEHIEKGFSETELKNK